MARRKELDPNVNGAKALGFTRVGGDDGSGGLDQIADHAGVLIVLGDPLADQDESFGVKADLFIYLGTHSSPATANADFTLPITTFAEQEGTFTNVQRRVQRFWPGLEAPGSALPAWFALGAVLAELTEEDAPRQAAQAFGLAAVGVPAYAGMSYETIGTRGAQMREPAHTSGD